MEWLDILQHIALGEGERVEFKRSASDLSPIGESICAFANTVGGVLILGVTDDRRIVGVNQNSENVQERLTSFLHTGCSAPVSARLGRHQDPNGWVHWIEVPHQRGFEPLRFRGRVFVRRGRSSVAPSPSELQELYNIFGYILTEERAIHAATLGDIDVAAFQSYLGSLGLDTETTPQPDHANDFRNRGVVVDIDGTLHPTLYGVLAFGRHPQGFPQTDNFWIQCVAYEGNDRASRVLQVSDAKGRLDDQVSRSLGWFSSIGRFESYGGLLRQDHHLVPQAALREALVNAVVHRDYAITGSKVMLEVFVDRVEITSPGGLPNHMSVDSVRAGGSPRSRNQLITNYMLVKGYMEQRGRGWPVMLRAMLQFNGTEPGIIQEGSNGHIRVTFNLTV